MAIQKALGHSIVVLCVALALIVLGVTYSVASNEIVSHRTITLERR